MCASSMRRSFKESVKVLEADIQHANTLASDFPREYDGACLQMRLSYSPAAHFFLFLVQWTDCHLAGALGLLRILIYKVYVDGTTTMSIHERKASIREFYAVIYPSLLQLERGVTDSEDKRQKAVCIEKYRKRDETEEYKHYISNADIEREEECGICMELNSKIVLPDCNHEMCLKCYRQCMYFDEASDHVEDHLLVFYTMYYGNDAVGGKKAVCEGEKLIRGCESGNRRKKSQSCPFCRDSLKRVSSGDLWVYTDRRDVVDIDAVTQENLQRLFLYIDKLPLIIFDSIFDSYDSHVR